MALFLNTASPLITLVYALIIASVVFISKKSESGFLIAILIFLIIGVLIYHSVALESLPSLNQTAISGVYHCIAIDLIFLLITFVSYLWIDDIIAKKKQLKSYDDSLSWFWNKL